jgi:Methyltransferase domain
VGFFDFLNDIAPYAEDHPSVQRLNTRHRMIVEPLAGQIAGKSVLDLAAHDGRWCHAFAAAGAQAVAGIEGRAELVARYEDYPHPEVKARVRLQVGDIFDGMEAETAAGRTYDVVGVLGIFYHIMDHFRLLKLVRGLRPGLVIVDGEFALRPGPVIVMARERVDNPLNAIAQVAGQDRTVIGIPSFAAMEVMADVLGLDLEWLDWDVLPQRDRAHVGDYYRPQDKRRATCLLRPR